MKALTIRQPWASLIALGVKTIETRSWATKHRGPVLIHAGAKAVPVSMANSIDGMMGAWWVVQRNPGWDCQLLDHRVGHGTDADVYDLPLGAVVAVADLTDCVPIVDEEDSAPAGWPDDGAVIEHARWADGEGLSWWPYGDGEHPADDFTDQVPYGDFTPGRFGWLLDNVRPIGPVPAKGKQGLWNPSPDLIEACTQPTRSAP